MKKMLIALVLTSPACLSTGVEQSEELLTAIRSDVHDETSFEVSVALNHDVDATRARWMLENLEILPFEEAFPGMARPEIDAREPEPPADEGGVRVTLDPLDPQIDAHDFAWRLMVPGASVPEHDEEIGISEQALDAKLSAGQSWRDSQYRCYVFAFNPILSGRGVAAVDRGLEGRAGTIQIPFVSPFPVLVPVPAAATTRAYWRGRVTAASTPTTVWSHSVSCL